ncbi:MAG TPA: flagellar basal body rod protein FlgB [Alphaproteobacteria bacterium]|nr:flagellar basal body rod protein FlgB [Alphaproteobacteria bacterium]
MDLQNLSLFRMLSARMHWLDQRQKVLAQNVANADTPHYEARDLQPLDFKGVLHETVSKRLRMATTSPLHKAGEKGLLGDRIREKSDTYQSSPTGNNVILEEEVMKAADIAADYETMSNLYTKSVGLLRLAIGGRNG